MTERTAVVVVAVVVVIAMAASDASGQTLLKLNLKPVSKQRMAEFTSFTGDLLSHKGPISYGYVWKAAKRHTEIASTASIIILRAYCQWLVDQGYRPLDAFCYLPPLNFS